jgi:antitoxin VapB
LPGHAKKTIFLPYLFWQNDQPSEMDTAKVFWSGRSQAVRLPKSFRFDATEVRIRRHGNAVILEPIADDWAWLDALAGPVDQDFVAAAIEQPPPQERAGLDTAFE